MTRTVSVPASTPGASFGVTVELVSGNQVAARGLAMRSKLRLGKPTKLRLKVTRGAGYMSVQAQTPAKLRLSKKPLKLRLKVRRRRSPGRPR